MLYTINYSKNYGYKHLNISLVIEKIYPNDISFHWQGDEEFKGWYGFRMNLITDSFPSYKELNKIINSIIGKEDSYEPTPEQIIEFLEKKKYRRAIYDRRISKEVALEEILPPNIKSWMDDYKKIGEDYCSYHVLAESEEKAKKLMRVKFAEGFSKERLKRFMDAEEPVILLDTAPEIPDYEKILKGKF